MSVNPNPWSLPRPTLRQETRTFTDPAHPGPNEPALQGELRELLARQKKARAKPDREALAAEIAALCARIEEDRPVKFTFTFRQPTMPDRLAARAIAADYITQWVDSGQAIPCPDAGQHPEAPVLFLTPEMAHIVAGLEALDQTEGAEKYTLTGWLGMMLVAPTAFANVGAWATELLGAAETAEGNS